MTSSTMDERAEERLRAPDAPDWTALDRLAERWRAGAAHATMRAMQPTGTVTFLFTDIEGSTRLLAALGDAYADVLEEHRKIVRAACDAHGGREFGAEGDALFVAFERASDAAAAAVGAQRGLAAHAWPEGVGVSVRMGLHTGEAELVDGDYVGLALHQAARICAAGHGGQILLSEATRHLVADRLPAGASARDLGEHHLKDLAEAQRLFQVAGADLTADFPPLRTLETLPNNLPVQLTRFIGREREMAEVRRLLAASRLLTLTGAGGCGKTRLAVHVAGDLVDRFADGVWLVELATVTDPALVLRTVAGVLGVREEPGRALAGSVSEAVRDRHALLILDNCEHLTAAVAEVADALLRAGPRLQVMATSREVLGIGGEATWRVPSLGLPSPDGLEPLHALTQYEAVRLFIDRARLANATFEVTESNAPAVAQTCHRLDGIPLAIELAAARVRLLTVEQMAERLDDLFRLLTGGSRTALPRQQTLRALIDWSHDLLTEPERIVLRRLSVFAGGFDLEGAERVCSGRGIDEGDVIELLQQLADKSLVQVAERDGAARYRLLETIRQYARERLVEAKESAETRHRHLEHFLSLAESLRGGTYPFVEPDDRAMPRFALEHDNMRAALAWAATDDEVPAGLIRLATDLSGFWARIAYWREGEAWIEQGLDRDDGSPTETRLRALFALTYQRNNLGRPAEGLPLLDEAATIARALGNPVALSAALRWHGWGSWFLARYGDFSTMWERALEAARASGDREEIALALGALGWASSWFDEHGEARALFEEALAVLGDTQNADLRLKAVSQLAHNAFMSWDLDTAIARFEEALALARRVAGASTVAEAAYGLSRVLLMRGQHERAAALLRESIAIDRQLGDAWHLWSSLTQLGRVEGARMRVRESRAAFEEALGLARDLQPREEVAPLVALAHIALGEGSVEEARAQAERAWDIADPSDGLLPLAQCLEAFADIHLAARDLDRAEQCAVQAGGIWGWLEFRGQIAAALDRLARIAGARGDHGVAARLLGTADGIRSAVGLAVQPVFQVRRDALVEGARSALGDDAFSAAVADGRSRHYTAAVAEMLERSAPLFASRRLFLSDGYLAVAASRWEWAGDEGGVVRCLERLAAQTAERGRLERAARLFGFADDRRARMSSPPEMDARAAAGLALVEEGVDPPTLQAAWRAWTGMSQVEMAKRFYPEIDAEQKEREGAPALPIQPEMAALGVNTFHREGEYWTVAYAGRATRLRETKGLRYIAALLAAQGREVHVADLLGVELDRARADAVLDPTARAGYERRIGDLRAEIDEASGWGDEMRAARARDEMDAIAQELGAAYGLGGRARTLGDPVERMRKAVGNRIRDALARIEREHPDLGRHLARAIRTGTFCAYEPEQAVAWET